MGGKISSSRRTRYGKSISCAATGDNEDHAEFDYVIAYNEREHGEVVGLLKNEIKKLELNIRSVQSNEEEDLVYLLISAPRGILIERAEVAGIFVPISAIAMKDILIMPSEIKEVSDFKLKLFKKKHGMRILERIENWFGPKLVEGHGKFRYKTKYDDLFCKEGSIVGIEEDPFVSSTRVRGNLVHEYLKEIELSPVLKREQDGQYESVYRGLDWLRQKGYVRRYFVPHSDKDRKRCKDMRRDGSQLDQLQLVTWLREYLGEKVGFLFAWRAAWLSWGLTIPALLGLLLTVISITMSVLRGRFPTVIFDNELLPVYAILALIIQINGFSYGWSKYKYKYAFKWGMLDYFSSRERQFKKITKMELLSRGDGLANEIRSFVFGSLTIVALLVFNLCCFALQQFLRNTLIERMVWSRQLASYTTTMVVSIGNTLFVVFFLNHWFARFARYLTLKEFHTFHSDYERSLTWKVFFYSFVANTLRLFMMAVFPKFTIHGFAIEFCDGEDNCVFAISVQLFFFLLLKPVSGNGGFIKDSLLQIVCDWLRRTEIKHALCEAVHLSDSDTELALRLDTEFSLYESDRFGERYQTLMDMNERVLQYGLVIMFGGIFPPAPVIAFIMEIIIRKFDIKRYIKKQRRQIPRHHEGVGCWEEIVDFVNILAMFTNVWMIVYRMSASRSVAEQMPKLGLILFGSIAALAYFIRVVIRENSAPAVVKRFQRAEIDMDVKGLQEQLRSLSETLQSSTRLQMGTLERKVGNGMNNVIENI